MKPVRVDPPSSELSIFLDEPQRGKHFWEFFTARIRNPNTRRAYFAAAREFSQWCQARRLMLDRIEPIHVASHIEWLGHRLAKPSVKLHLAAIRMLFDWLVVSQVIAVNPASPVRGPRYSQRTGKTPVLSADQARHLLDSIDATTLAGCRDRALISVMLFSFARVGAVVSLRVRDFFQQAGGWCFRFEEKGGKLHQVPAHAEAAQAVLAWLSQAGGEGKSPLFRSIGRGGVLKEAALNSNDVLRMIKRRAVAAGLPPAICCHSFRATGITIYLGQGGSIEKAQTIAAHESLRTTKLYDRSGSTLELAELNRIRI